MVPHHRAPARERGRLRGLEGARLSGPGPRAEWEAIGAAFSETRPTPWPPVVDWLDRLVGGSRVLDLGAGNGRHGLAAEAKGHPAIGADFAASLARIAYARGLPMVLADARSLPFREASFDALLYVASLHHLPSREGRRAALADTVRVLRPGAHALVTVWYRGDEAAGDARVPWRAGAEEVARYYHFYRQDELRADLEAAGFSDVQVEDRSLGQGPRARNLWAEARKA